MENNLDSIVNNFCKELVIRIPEFRELAAAKLEVESDPASKQLWTEKEEHRQTVELMKSKGLPVSEEQVQRLAQKLEEMRENPITMRYLKALNFASKVSGKIGYQLSEGIGVDFAPRKGCK